MALLINLVAELIKIPKGLVAVAAAATAVNVRASLSFADGSDFQALLMSSLYLLDFWARFWVVRLIQEKQIKDNGDLIITGRHAQQRATGLVYKLEG